jgi:hypothetical protein
LIRTATINTLKLAIDEDQANESARSAANERVIGGILVVT